ncbi:MAG TPA: hypothetical protein VMH81_32635 [Bryobacteraceae bacterium]|nr:hypothetical protein [Bryobacteraceae bacterium]
MNGRKQETLPPSGAEGIRKLPRRPGMVPEPPNAEEYARMLAAELDALKKNLDNGYVGPRIQSEDRVRPLVYSSAVAGPLPPPEDYAPRLDPKPPDVVANVVEGYAGPTMEFKNRWFIFPGLPWKRYQDPNLDAIYAHTKVWDPFNRNILKGDFPFHGRRQFFLFTGISSTTVETKRLPIGSGASAADPGEYTFFGRGEIGLIQQNFRFSMDLFRGSAGFRPVDWELRITPEFNINYTLARENGVINSDVRQSIRRTDSNVGMQEAFLEKRLFSEKGHFDFTSVRLGIQRFTSDFRGFVFSDEQPGARLFGEFHNNIFQYNLAYFEMLEKDTNSGLNRWRLRDQQVAVANMYIADFLTKGYTLNLSALYNHDQPSFLVDKNGFLVRPAPIGGLAPPVLQKIRAAYAGVTGDGHIGRITVDNAFYYAFGRNDNNSIPLTKPNLHISAYLAALELSYEKDWYTYKISGFYTSGAKDLRTGQANGFDGIVPNQQFAGGGFLGNPSLADRGLLNNEFEGGGINFLNREAVPLSDTGVNLFAPNNLMPTMRAGLFEGQANFLNPGIALINAGYIAKITPKLQGTLNVNYAKFNRTEVLQAVLFQEHIHHAIGLDSGIGFQYRPLLTDNIVIFTGFGALVPGRGFKDIYTGRTLFDAFINLRFLF